MMQFLRLGRASGGLPALLFALSCTWAQPPASERIWSRAETDPAELKRVLHDDDVAERWIYHDLEAARRAASKSGKPVLAIFRCVPCGSVPKLDEQISGAESPLADLLDRFVCVRVVKMNGVDRNVFDFDRDVPYLAVILNGDGTIYGRWGTRTSISRSDLPRHTIGSFRTALETALALHEGYPANRAELAAKNNRRIETPSLPEEMSTMKPHPGNPPEVRNCIHCHMVGEAKLALTLQAGKPSLNDLWPYPSADNLGLRLDFADGLKVKSVVRGSIAETAGVRAGDKLHAFERQRLVSEADLQWGLHHLPDEARPKLAVLRDGEPVEVALALTGEWRKGPVEWRESIAPARPDVNFRPQFGKDKLGIAADEMALTVYYPRLNAAQAGLRNGDVLISVDGRKDLHTEADLLKYIHVDRPDARSAELGVLRNGERLTITLPLR